MRLLELTDDRYHPRELELALPPGVPSESMLHGRRPAGARCAPDLYRLSGRMHALVSCGNRGAGSPYPSRSEADFSVCLAMFGAGYSEADGWAVITDPANGISEKYMEKGSYGDAYLSLTVGKASALARSVG